MKQNRLFIILLFACLLAGKTSYQQAKPAYQLPDSYHFDYEVVQASISKKNANDTTTMHYFYTKSGDYAGLKVGRKTGRKEDKFIIFTKDGISIIVDDDRKNITIINTRNMMGDVANMAKNMKKDSVPAHMKNKIDPKQYKSVKTGKTKQIGSYTSEEYQVTDSSGRKTSIWYAKVDFNAQSYYLLGLGAGGMMKMDNGGMIGSPLFQTLADPKNLITDIVTEDSPDGKGMNMHTTSISNSSASIPTKGYEVKDYSNMDLKEMMQEMQKKKAD